MQEDQGDQISRGRPVDPCGARVLGRYIPLTFPVPCHDTHTFFVTLSKSLLSEASTLKFSRVQGVPTWLGRKFRHKLRVPIPIHLAS